MAIYHCSIKVISRGIGRSAVGSSAYRSGEKIENERDGIVHDYTNKEGVEHTEIQAPDNAPEWATDRAKLWNEVEKIEKRNKSQLARDINVALPRELSKEQNIELVREYVKENFVDKGMVADIAVHIKSVKNPHAHIMLTMRPFKEDGSWGAKQKKEYILDKDGKKQYDPKKKTYKCNTIKLTDWDEVETLKQWRKNWDKIANKYLERNGIKERIDHRSYAEQGIQKIPTIHEGHVVRAMEKKGKQTEKGSRNREIIEANKMIELLDRQIRVNEKQKERMLENERGTENHGTRNGDSGVNGRIGTGERGQSEVIRGIGTGEREKPRVDWGAVELDTGMQENRLSEQSSHGIVDEVRRKVREVKETTDRNMGETTERTNRSVEASREQNTATRDKQQPVKRVHKSRGFDLDR